MKTVKYLTKISDTEIARLIKKVESRHRSIEAKRRIKRIKNARQKRESKKVEYVMPDWFKPYRRKYIAYIEFDVKRKFERILDYSFEEFKDILQGQCYYCSNSKSLGLDRIDNSKGHTKDNTLVACGTCNLIRRNIFTVEQMKEIGVLIHKFNEKTNL